MLNHTRVYSDPEAQPVLTEATPRNCVRHSAEGARYDSQGQARSASPLDRVKKLGLEP
jgi:hypothetical protein